MQESLRFQTPAVTTSQYEFTKDTKIGDITVKAYDAFVIDFYSLHLDAAQWQKPLEFIPERFDSSNPLSLAPNGKKRHPNSFASFSGGKRVCFGKTFAEISMKIVATYITQSFDMKIVNEKYETENPVNHFGMIGTKKLEIAFTKRK